MPDLTTLPIELLSRISALLDWSSLAHLSLVAKCFTAPAQRELFRLVAFSPAEESVARFESVLGSEVVKTYVKRVRVYTWEEDLDSECNEGDQEIPDEFLEAISKITEFSNLNAVDVGFDEECCDDEEDYMVTWPQSQEIRTDLLLRVVNTLATGSGENVVHLGLKNFQNDLSTTLLENDNWQKLNQRLKSLRLNIVHETDEAAPENEIFMKNVHRFWKELRPKWLDALAPNLTSLTLYCNTYWGMIPFFDLRGLHLPTLHALNLGNMAIWTEWQVDWICSHRLLRELSLDDCAIVTRISYDSYFASQCLRGKAPDMTPFFDAAPTLRRAKCRPSTWINAMTWHAHILPRFRHELLHLSTFRFGNTDWHGAHARNGPPFAVEHTIRTALWSSRYRVFDCGIGPSQWTELLSEDQYTQPDGFSDEAFKKEKYEVEEEDVSKTETERDKVELVKLLQKIGQVVVEDYEATHYCSPFEVKGLVADTSRR